MSIYASTVLGVAILSVRLSVRLSHAWIVTKLNDACRYFDTRRKSNHSAILTLKVVNGRRSLPSEICAQSDPPLSEKADFDRFQLITSQPQEIAKKFNHDEQEVDHVLSSELYVECIRCP